MLRSFLLFLIIFCTLQITPLIRAQGLPKGQIQLSTNGFPQEGENYRVIVYDGDLEVPIQLAVVSLRRDGYVIAQKVDEPCGTCEICRGH